MHLISILTSVALIISGTKISTVAAGDCTSKTVSIISDSQFCLLLPGQDYQSIGESEGSAVSKCYGMSLPCSDTIPSDAIISAHFVETDEYVQVTGRIDTDMLKIGSSGGGGQYDDASWGSEPKSNCAGYPRYLELVETGGNSIYCIRCCKNESGGDVGGPCDASNDTKGCEADIPGDYGDSKSKSGTSSQKNNDKNHDKGKKKNNNKNNDKNKKKHHNEVDVKIVARR
ncbi:hypothetical protein HDU76_002705 [Blyttiomyces sp. JEL0837]|nr:hypothetical protein HDU76_002705 [Blyttiomyces sp. JEL0837]